MISTHAQPQSSCTIHSLSFDLFQSAFVRFATYSDFERLAQSSSILRVQLVNLLTKGVFEKLSLWMAPYKSKFARIQHDMKMFQNPHSDVKAAGDYLKDFEESIIDVIDFDISFLASLNDQEIPPFFHRLHAIYKIAKLLQKGEQDQAKTLIFSIQTPEFKYRFNVELARVFAKNGEYKKALDLPGMTSTKNKIGVLVRHYLFHNEEIRSIREKLVVFGNDEEMINMQLDLMITDNRSVEIGDVDLEKAGKLLEAISENLSRFIAGVHFQLLKKELMIFHSSEKDIQSSRFDDAYNKLRSSISSSRKNVQCLKISENLLNAGRVLPAIVAFFAQGNLRDCPFLLDILDGYSMDERFTLYSDIFYKKDTVWQLNRLDSFFKFFIKYEKERLEFEVSKTSEKRELILQFNNAVDAHFTDEIIYLDTNKFVPMNLKERTKVITELL